MTGLAVAAPQRARPADLSSARDLLCAAGLPIAGIEEHLARFWAVRTTDGRAAGNAGGERYGATWLLRSLVVDPAARGQGVGSALVTAALHEARELGARDVFLLTTDAHDFFAARGVTAGPRAAGPTPLRASEELRGACPDTATLMRLEVAP